MKITDRINKLTAFLHPKDNDYVAIDLGMGLVKACLVKNNQLEDIFIGKGGDYPSAIALLKEKGLASKKLKVSIKGPSTIVRCIPFPKAAKSNLREAIGYELSKYIPFPENSIYYDIFVLDDNYSREELFVLIAGAKKETVDSLLQEFRQANLEVQEITLNSIALTNLFSVTESNSENTLIVDIGFSSTLLNILKKGLLYLSREIKISGKNVLDKIRDYKPPSEGEELKYDWIGSEEIIVEFLSEIKNSSDYFEMNVGEKIQKILLTGGYAHLEVFRYSIQSTINARLEIWKPTETLKIKLSSEAERVKNALSVVIGLSL